MTNEFTLHPTPEVVRFFYTDGHPVDVRVWRGHVRTIPVEAYVLSVIACNPKEDGLLRLCIPGFMQRTRNVLRLDPNAEPVRLCTLCFGPLYDLSEHANGVHADCDASQSQGEKA